jgi:hypothetical protein
MMSVSESLNSGRGNSNYLGHGAVIDLDKVARGRIDLETVVEGQSGVKRSGSYKINVSVYSMFLVIGW